jgi:large subunit ribosomal protein L11
VAAKKQITRIAKIQLIGGQAKPGPALASIGINMAEFTKQFNDKTKARNGEVVPCVITAFSDKSFTFIIKTSPTSVMLKKAAKLETAGKNQLTDHVATITKAQALEIAKYKMPDLNAYDEEAALKMVAGTAKQMGIKIEGVDSTSNKDVKNESKK